jgi:hypothetical protein
MLVQKEISKKLNFVGILKATAKKGRDPYTDP